MDGDIVGLAGESFGTADRKGQAHRRVGDPLAAQPLQKAVVVAPSVAQAVAVFIKGQSGDQNEGAGEVAVRQSGTGLVRLRDPEAGGGEAG